MFDIGWSEMAVIAVVALVVIGPKDLPRALKTVGLWVRKARSISREFQGHVDQMIREAELDELREQVEKVNKLDLKKEIEKTVDPTGSLAESLKPVELPDLRSAFETPTPGTPPVPDAPAAGSAPAAPTSEPETPAEAATPPEPPQLAEPPKLAEPAKFVEAAKPAERPETAVAAVEKTGTGA
jgi:sec-independent protein translocase protein TatB